MNRDEKRTTVNMEYLKNVVLRFLESNEKEVIFFLQINYIYLFMIYLYNNLLNKNKNKNKNKIK